MSDEVEVPDERVTWTCPPILVIKWEPLLRPGEDRDSRHPYLVIQLDSEVIDGTGYVTGQVIGELPYTEAAHALMKSIGTRRD